MSFWDLSDGGSAKSTDTEFEIGGGNFDPIPAGSSVLAIIDQAQWTRKDRNDLSSPEYLELRWEIVKPEQYAKRKIFHKLWVADLDPNAKDEAKAKTKRDKALRLLSAIDANAGGKLATLDGKPTDNQLGVALSNKPMVITLMTWDDQNKVPQGNWVSAVAPKTKELVVKAAAPSRAAPVQQQSASAGWGHDDEIPF